MLLLSLLLAAITVKADVPRLTAAELDPLLQKGEAIAVDVRGSVPYELGHIPGAVWLPLGLLQQRAGELPQDKLLVMYCTCKAEETSLEAAMMLTRLGFERVAALHGGYPAWTGAGLATESNRNVPEGRLARPAAVSCKGDLTSYAGKVKRYQRSRGKTVLVIATASGTTETITLRHRGSDDPSRFFLVAGTPFMPADWNRVEKRKGELVDGLGVVAWVCTGGETIIDWRPGTSFHSGT
jgi:rhodanese-related sulfurtransferase